MSAFDIAVPDHFLCPISLEIIKEPVICSDGITYEKKQIARWFRNHNTSPKTNVELLNKSLIPNYALKSGIGKYLSSRTRVTTRSHKVGGGVAVWPCGMCSVSVAVVCGMAVWRGVCCVVCRGGVAIRRCGVGSVAVVCGCKGATVHLRMHCYLNCIPAHRYPPISLTLIPTLTPLHLQPTNPLSVSPLPLPLSPPAQAGPRGGHRGEGRLGERQRHLRANLSLPVINSGKLCESRCLYF
jgi:hypothetical protein